MASPSRRPAQRALDAVRRHLVTLRAPEHSEKPPVLVLRRLVAEVKSPGSAMAWLAAYDPESHVHEAAGMMLFLVAQDPTVPPGLRRAIGRAAAPWLLRAMQDPGVSDERKYVLGPLLGLCGIDLSEADYRACFRDLDQVHRGKSREAMRQVLDRPEHLERLLHGLGVLDDDGEAGDAEDAARALDLGVSMLEHNPSVGAVLVGTCAVLGRARDLSPDTVGRALEHVAETRTPRAAWILGELSRLPGLGPVGETARALEQALESLGVSPQPSSPGDFSHGYVTGVDGAGAQTVSIFARSGEGTLHALNVHMDEDGVRDAWCVFDSGDQLDEQLRRVPLLSSAPADPAYARELVGHALWRHQERDVPPPARLLLFRGFLGPEPLLPACRPPRLGAYLLETVVPSPELVAGSEELLEHPLFGDLCCVSDAAYALVGKYVNKRRGRATLAWRKSVAADLASVAKDERQGLERRLAANLEVESRAGRARRPMNRLAARTWLGLTEGVVPFEEVPYVRGLCDRAVLMICRNIRAGHTSQRAANAARQATDERARRALDRFEDDDDSD